MKLRIAICALADIPVVAPVFQPTHAVTLLDPHNDKPAVSGVGERDHIFIGMHDIFRPRDDHVHPQEHHVDSLLSFGETLRPAVEGDGARVLVHCWAGVSRSSAAAYTLKCQLTPLSEAEALEAVHSVRQEMWPNELIVALADAALGRGGRMIEALEAWREQQPVKPSHPFWEAS